MTFSVSANVVVKDKDGFNRSISVPSFTVEAFDENEAIQKADDIINPTKASLSLHTTVVPI